MRIFVCALAAVLFAGLSSPAAVHAQVAELGVMFWNPTPQVVLSSDDLSVADVDEVDFIEEFGIAKKRFPEFRAAVGRVHKFRISHISFQYDAESTIRRTFTFRNQTFVVGAPAQADVSWNLWKLGYEWDFVSQPQGFVGVIADLKYNKVQGMIDSPALSSAAETEVEAWVPTIGIVARAYLTPALAVTGEITGLRINRNEFVARFLDFDVNATVFFGRNVGAQGGYRLVNVEYLIDEDEGRLEMRGLYFGGVLRF